LTLEKDDQSLSKPISAKSDPFHSTIL